MKQKKNSLLAFFILTASATFLIYGCASDEYDFMGNSSAENPIMSTLSVADSSSKLIGSISESKEFLDFVKSCNTFSDKIDVYISTLTEEERNIMIHNANNDDYVSDFVKHVDIKREVENMYIAREELFNNTSYKQLNELEESTLFYNYLGVIEPMFIKTRQEGEELDKCAKAKKAAYDAAYAAFVRRLGLCDYLPNDDKFACQVASKLNYEAEKTQADTEYKKCVGE